MSAFTSFPAIPEKALTAPSIPAEWDGFKVKPTCRGCHLMIEVKNPDHVRHEVRELRVDGEIIELKNSPLLTEGLLNGCQKASVHVTMES